jgi:hypothetical protein
MNRRTLLLRSFMLPVAATVFTVSGWLMGTRSLTMPPPEGRTPPPGQGTGTTYRVCDGFCDLDCAYDTYCVDHFWHVDTWLGCSNHGCPYGWCQWQSENIQEPCA